MIKKIALLALAATIAASSVASAAGSKKIKLTNESSVGYYYKVGKSVKYIPAGGSKSFALPSGKKVRIQASESKSGGFKTKSTFTKSEVRKDPFIQVNPVTGQTTDVK